MPAGDLGVVVVVEEVVVVGEGEAGSQRVEGAVEVFLW